LRETFELARARLAVITSVIGDFVGSAIALIFYFTILIPFALIARSISDPLQRTNSNIQWLDREAVSSELDRARRQG
jgi:hypothetical protein